MIPACIYMAFCACSGWACGVIGRRCGLDLVTALAVALAVNCLGWAAILGWRIQ